MNNQVVSIQNQTQQQPRKSVLVEMASRFDMDHTAFETVLRNTVLKPDKNGKQASKEEFTAFLMVAKEYNLNPLTKEIYAFPDKSGGLQPIVPIDGWLKIINQHPDFDGLETEEIWQGSELIAIKCIIHRKDRSHPTIVTEYLAECKGPSEPWRRWPVRMLRWKAIIQCGRVAFGYSGIVDEDEAERIKQAQGMQNVTPNTSNNHMKEAVTTATIEQREEASQDLNNILFANNQEPAHEQESL